MDEARVQGSYAGFQWKDLDWEHSTITLARQLVKRWPTQLFDPPKRKQLRTIDLSAHCLGLNLAGGTEGQNRTVDTSFSGRKRKT